MDLDLLGTTAEGIISSVIDPIKITMIINKLEDVDVSLAKNDMHMQMQSTCINLPMSDNVVPGI